MGEVVAAALLSHVPTIMLPKDVRYELNDGREISIVTGLERLRKEKFETLDYDTVIVLDSHWFTTVEFVVTSHARRAGLFTAEELPRGMCRIPYEWRGDPELAEAIAARGEPMARGSPPSTTSTSRSTTPRSTSGATWARGWTSAGSR